MRLRWVVAAAVLALGACRVADTPFDIEVHASVVLCPSGASDCYQLPLPHADVLTTGGGDYARSGETDDHGIAHFDVIDPGVYTVRVDSFAFENKYAEATITVGGGRFVTVDLAGNAAK